MKKLVSFLAVAFCTVTIMTAQVLQGPGVQNTLSTVMGLPYGDATDPHREPFHWYGFHETIQARADLFNVLTFDGMLNWGALTYYNGYGADLAGLRFCNTTMTPFTYTNDWSQGNEQTNGYTDSYYVNFVLHPFAKVGIDIGLGTRLNWIVGPAPNYNGMLFEPTSHIVQGGLKDGEPVKYSWETAPDSVGFIHYANNYARKALGFRFVNQYVEVGVALPDGAHTGHFNMNIGLRITPTDALSIGLAWEGDIPGENDLYTGVTIRFADFIAMEAWAAFDELGDKDKDAEIGTGGRLIFNFNKIRMTLKPEAGINFFQKYNGVPSWYGGARMDWWIAEDKFMLGTWTSIAFGYANPYWFDEHNPSYSTTKNYVGGFVFDIRPDITFVITKRHSISAMFDFQSRHAYNNKIYNGFATAVYWTFKI